MQKPNYKKIYEEILKRKKIKKKINDKMSIKDVLKISKIINPNNQDKNQKHKSYDLDYINYVLNDQLKHNYTNTEVANKYNLSRNTITKWKKNFNL
ncbi:helix-turn-helix domain-containing protein [Chishuiella sp.]|uniref:helix-turn-helix domain-containing protein n=1 Tax=Chishuiella sp. TaxID=1969467 RepID=UPI0028B148E1|nr:helix-turn-helix domain-containing protein [Chishuiella sp.]